MTLEPNQRSTNVKGVVLEDLRQVLANLEGEATLKEIRQAVNDLYSTSRLGIKDALQFLEEKDHVRSKRNNVWQLTETGWEQSLSISLIDIDTGVSQQELEKLGLEVSNIVATFKLDRGFDLLELDHSIPDAEYEPEQSPFLLYRPLNESNTTVIVPSNGIISITGAKDRNELIRATKIWIEKLNELGIQVSKLNKDITTDIQIQNIVVRGIINQEFDLNVLAISLGVERTEYDPEQFPALNYYTSSGSLVLMFRSGKFVITGLTSYTQALIAANCFTDNLAKLGIDVKLSEI